MGRRRAGGARGAESRRWCALIVDGDPEIHRSLARYLGPELDVYAADSVVEGVELVDALEGADLAFVELELRDGSGERVLERLARWPDGIRVVLAGSERSRAAPPMAEPAFGLRDRALANLILGKPLSFDLVKRLKKAALRLPKT